MVLGSFGLANRPTEPGREEGILELYKLEQFL